MKKGLFISIEGPDGSGKTTITRRLTEYLKDKGYDIIVTREPGGTYISEKIRKIILDNKNADMSPMTEALLYAASRAQHVYEKILPALNKGKIVISERFVHSSLVYQGIGRNLGVDKIKEINDFAIQGVMPDVTLFFKVDPEKALKRKRKRNKGDRLEREAISFHKEVYNGYLKLTEIFPNEIKVVDATKGVDDIFIEVKEIINNYLKKLEEEQI